MRTRVLSRVSASLAMIAGVVVAQTEANPEARMAELERKVDVLSAELERTRFGEVIPEIGDGAHGMAPAASKVYHTQQGVSIGGYGEALYENRNGGSDQADFLRGVIYLGYKYGDRWVFNSEIEFEHASTGENGSASVEFAYLDYLHAEALNFRAGLILVPMGLINELHEPTSFLSARRPDVENRILPATWRENGLGLFGSLGERVAYKAYVVNGLEGEDFSASGLRGGRQKGSKAKADDLAGVLRVDYTPITSLMLGGSFYYGNSGQDLEMDLTTGIAEAHLDGRWHGLQVRALATLARLDDVAELNRLQHPEDEDAEIDSVGEKMWGWYGEVGYDLLNRMDAGEKSLTPFVRYEAYNTQDEIPDGFATSGANDVTVVTAGINFKPIDEIVFKADYQFYDDAADSRDDQFNLAMGYVF